MTSRSELREAPPRHGPDWPNNGEIYERMRVDLLVRAEEAEAAGEVELGEELRERAAFQRRERNRCFEVHDRRILNRHMAADKLRRRYPS
jgi:hypothetical protein